MGEELLHYCWVMPIGNCSNNEKSPWETEYDGDECLWKTSQFPVDNDIIDKTFVKFVNAHKSFGVFHPKNTCDTNKHDWNEYPHLHMITAVKADITLSDIRSFKNVRKSVNKAYGRKLHTQHVKYMPGLAKYMMKPPREVVGYDAIYDEIVVTAQNAVSNMAAETDSDDDLIANIKPEVPKDTGARKSGLPIEIPIEFTSKYMPHQSTLREKDFVEDKSKYGKGVATVKQSNNAQAIEYIHSIIKKNLIKDSAGLVEYMTESKDKCERHQLFEIYALGNYSLLVNKALALEKELTSLKSFSEQAHDYFNGTHKACGRYYDIPESMCKLRGICVYNSLDMCHFVERVRLVGDKIRAKKNMLVLQGPPNSCKSYIVRSIIAVFRFYGEIQSGSSYNFLYNDCVGKNAIIYEEPVLDPVAIEKFKLISEGSPTYVPVKNQGDRMIKRTPIFVTTNKNIWHYSNNNRGALQARGYYFGLRQFPQARMWDKQLNPGMWHVLLSNNSRDCQEEAGFLDAADVAERNNFEVTDPTTSGSQTAKKHGGLPHVDEHFISSQNDTLQESDCVSTASEENSQSDSEVDLECSEHILDVDQPQYTPTVPNTPPQKRVFFADEPDSIIPEILAKVAKVATKDIKTVLIKISRALIGEVVGSKHIDKCTKGYVYDIPGGIFHEHVKDLKIPHSEIIVPVEEGKTYMQEVCRRTPEVLNTITYDN